MEAMVSDAAFDCVSVLLFMGLFGIFLTSLILLGLHGSEDGGFVGTAAGFTVWAFLQIVVDACRSAYTSAAATASLLYAFVFLGCMIQLGKEGVEDYLFVVFVSVLGSLHGVALLASFLTAALTCATLTEGLIAVLYDLLKILAAFAVEIFIASMVLLGVHDKDNAQFQVAIGLFGGIFGFFLLLSCGAACALGVEAWGKMNGEQYEAVPKTESGQTKDFAVDGLTKTGP